MLGGGPRVATSSFGVAALTQRDLVACCLGFGCWQILSLGLVDSWSDPGVGGIGWFGRIVELSFGQNFQKCTVPAWCSTTHPLGYFPKYLAGYGELVRFLTSFVPLPCIAGGTRSIRDNSTSNNNDTGIKPIQVCV